jgi:acyl-CoA synthetase (AMP-forming)/AMP-acid ligase II
MLLYKLFEEALKNNPDKEAIIFKGRSTSYRELYDLMNRSARALLSLGIVRGDRVAIFMENRVELVELYFACFRIGAIAVPSTIVRNHSELDK